MKTLATLLRHGITYLVGLLVAWFTIYLTGDDLKAATEAGHALIEPLVVICGFVAVILARLALPFVQKIFQRGAGETGRDSGGGLSPCVMLGVVAAASFIVSLPSCSPEQIAAARAIPIKACYIAPDGSHLCYSTKDGVEIDVASHK